MSSSVSCVDDWPLAICQTASGIFRVHTRQVFFLPGLLIWEKMTCITFGGGTRPGPGKNVLNLVADPELLLLNLDFYFFGVSCVFSDNGSGGSLHFRFHACNAITVCGETVTSLFKQHCLSPISLADSFPLCLGNFFSPP